MANKTETRPRQGGDAVNGSVVLRKVMEVLSVKGFARASIADLTSAAGVDSGTLHKTFGTRDEILRSAIQFCADTEASLAQEPLRVSPTGREAILSMLEENVRLRRHWPRYCGCLFAFNAFVIPQEDASLQEFLIERRRSLSKQIRLRLVRSVHEGELPQDTNCELVANLCLTLLSGLTSRVLDGAPPGPLFRSLELFVNAIGFAPRPGRAISHASPLGKAPSPAKNDESSQGEEAMKPKETVQALLNDIRNPETVRDLCMPDVTYVSLNYSNPDLRRIMPWCGTGKGRDAISQTFHDVSEYWRIDSFVPEAIVGEDGNVAVFGRFTYTSTKLRKTVTSPFAIFCKVLNGKVTYMQFMEDTFATAASFRSGGSWMFQSDPHGGEVEI